MDNLSTSASRTYHSSLKWILLSPYDVDRILHYTFGQIVHPLCPIWVPFRQFVEEPPNHGGCCSAQADCYRRCLGNAQTADAVSRHPIRTQNKREPDEIAG